MFTEGFFSYIFSKVFSFLKNIPTYFNVAKNTLSNSSTFIKKYSTIGLVVVTIIGMITIISNVTEIASYFGIQTRAQLKEELIVKQQDLAKAVDAAKNLEDEYKKEVEATKMLDTVISDKDGAEVVLDNKVEEVVVKHKEVTTKVVVKNKVEKTNYSKADMDKVAAANISAIWDVYNDVVKI